MGAGAAQAASADAPVPTPVVHDATSALDERTAVSVAEKFGHAVIVDGLTTATNRTEALPDGTMKLEASAVPVRTKVDGKWADLDLNLADDGGFVVPKAAAQKIEFSGGGSGPLARVLDGAGTWVEEASPFGSLPSPTLKGAVATYPNVLPGVDIRLTATATGMSEVLVVKDATAAKNPALAKVRFGIDGSSLSADPSGNVHAGAKGSKGIVAGTATWWDSSHGSTAKGPADDVVPQPVTQSVTSDSITFDVAAAATSSDVTYPVFIDPPWSSGDSHAWFIDAGFPNQAYLDSNPYSTVEKSGYIPASASGSGGVAHTARSFWNFNTSGLAGKQMLAAQFSATLNGAFNCSQMRQTNLWTTSGAPIGGTWNSTIPVTAFPAVIGSATPGGCGAAVGWNALGAAQNASAGVTSTTLALVAYSESDQYAWSKWNQGATLSITYNSVPNAPTGLAFTSPSRTCSTNPSTPAYVDGTQPMTLSVNSTDPDSGQNLVTYFGIHGVDNTAFGWSTNTASQAAGPASVTVPANTVTAVGEYRWDAQINDGYIAGPASVDCYFRIANDSPAMPTVTQTSSGTPVVGQPMTVTFGSSAADGVQLFAYWWEDDSNTTPQSPPATTVSNPASLCGSSSVGVSYVCPDSGSTNATGVIVAPTDHSATLWVASYNAAGKVSNDQTSGHNPVSAHLSLTPSVDTTNVSTTDGHIWDSQFIDSTATAVPDSNTTAGTSGTTTRQAIGDDVHLADGSIDGIPMTVFSYSGSSSASLSDRAAIDTKNSFSVSAWLNPTSTGLHTALSESTVFDNGTQTGSGFTLGTDANGNALFCRTSQVDQAQACATGTAVTNNQWTFVTGIWDSVNKQLRVLIADHITPVGVAPQAVPANDTSATGWFCVGAECPGDVSTHQWVGQIYRPAVFPGVESTSQLVNLFSGYAPNDTDPPADESIGAVVNQGCDDLITPDDIYNYNPNFVHLDDWTPDAGTPAAQAVAWNGLGCRWMDEDPDAATIDMSVANIQDLGTMQQLQASAAANGTAVTGEGDSAYYRTLAGGIGELTVFSGSYWITLRSAHFGSGTDADPLPADIIAGLTS